MATIGVAQAANITAAGVVSAASTAAIAGGDYTITLMVSSLVGTIRIGVEDTADGTTWSPVAVWEIAGAAGQESEHERSYDAPGLVTAGSSPQARLNVYKIAGSAAATLVINY